MQRTWVWVIAALVAVLAIFSLMRSGEPEAVVEPAADTAPAATETAPAAEGEAPAAEGEAPATGGEAPAN